MVNYFFTFFATNMKIKQIINNKLIIKLPKSQKSLKGREDVASELSSRFQKLMLPIKENELTVKEYKKMVYRLLYPAHPKITVHPNDTELVNGSFICDGKSVINNKTGDLEYQHKQFSIAYNLKDDKIVSGRSTIVHETRHLFDAMCNPKSILVDCLYEYPHNDSIFDLANSLKATVTPFKSHLSKELLSSMLQDVDNSSAIAILQDLRRELKAEINAYTDVAKFQIKEMPFYKKPYAWLVFHTGYKKSMKLWDNLAIIEQELANRLRNRHSS